MKNAFRSGNYLKNFFRELRLGKINKWVWIYASGTCLGFTKKKFQLVSMCLFTPKYK